MGMKNPNILHVISDGVLKYFFKNMQANISKNHFINKLKTKVYYVSQMMYYCAETSI